MSIRQEISGHLREFSELVYSFFSNFVEVSEGKIPSESPDAIVHRIVNNHEKLELALRRCMFKRDEVYVPINLI